MVTEIDKNIFEFDWDVLIHQANCFHVMGTGIALLVKTKYPIAYEADLATGKGDPNKFGSYSTAVLSDDTMIVNMYSQFRYGRNEKHTSYDKMCLAFEKLIIELKDIGVPLTIAIPYRLGCNNAGGSWPIVRSIVDHYFSEEGNLHLYICKWEK